MTHEVDARQYYVHYIEVKMYLSDFPGGKTSKKVGNLGLRKIPMHQALLP